MAKAITSTGRVVDHSKRTGKRKLNGINSESSRRRIRDVFVLRMAESGWTLAEVAYSFDLLETTVKGRHALICNTIRKSLKNPPKSMKIDFEWPVRENRKPTEIKKLLSEMSVEIMTLGFTTKDIAKVFNIHEKTARRWIGRVARVENSRLASSEAANGAFWEFFLDTKDRA